MGARIAVPLGVLLPCLAASGAIATGVAMVSGTSGYLVRQARRIPYVYGPDDTRYAISGPAGPGQAGLTVVMTGLAGASRITGQGSRPALGIDTSVPDIARMYAYWLGGKDNFAADREAAERQARAIPQLPRLARQNRDFLRRAVRFCAGEQRLHEDSRRGGAEGLTPPGGTCQSRLRYHLAIDREQPPPGVSAGPRPALHKRGPPPPGTGGAASAPHRAAARCRNRGSAMAPHEFERIATSTELSEGIRPAGKERSA